MEIKTLVTGGAMTGFTLNKKGILLPREKQALIPGDDICMKCVPLDKRPFRQFKITIVRRYFESPSNWMADINTFGHSPFLLCGAAHLDVQTYAVKA